MPLDNVHAIFITGYTHLQEPLNVEMAHDVQPAARRVHTGPEVPQWVVTPPEHTIHMA